MISLTLAAQFRKSKSNPSSRYHASSTPGQGNFYPLNHSTARRSRRDPDEALLESVHMASIGKPLPVRVKTEIIVHYSAENEDQSVVSRESY